jgi:hypothetical protein
MQLIHWALKTKPRKLHMSDVPWSAEQEWAWRVQELSHLLGEPPPHFYSKTWTQPTWQDFMNIMQVMCENVWKPHFYCDDYIQTLTSHKLPLLFNRNFCKPGGKHQTSEVLTCCNEQSSNNNISRKFLHNAPIFSHPLDTEIVWVTTTTTTTTTKKAGKLFIQRSCCPQWKYNN